ncbi:hypothetical protein KVT40_001513 [Elsinoe batatas]|uniref:Uncharacterized protein n=1 Tax=Elsinoe batatas TaxID=2601811 RepID=A0A8K0PLF7_9PEZI|nr:hypothetical protein KVT40_001513 [Elsinoe batatas]
MLLTALLLPVAVLAVPVRSIPVSISAQPLQQVATLQTQYTGPSISPAPDQDRIGLRMTSEMVHEDYVEVVEVMAFLPVGEKVFVYDNPVLPCNPQKVEIVSIPLNSVMQKHVCVISPEVTVEEGVNDVKVSRAASVIVTDTDGVVDLYSGQERRTLAPGEMVASFQCF